MANELSVEIARDLAWSCDLPRVEVCGVVCPLLRECPWSIIVPWPHGVSCPPGTRCPVESSHVLPS